MLTEKNIQDIIHGEAQYLSKPLGEIGTIMAADYEGLWGVVRVNPRTGEIDFTQVEMFHDKECALAEFDPDQDLMFRFIPVLQEVDIV
jgi:hypothetical protein